MTREALLREVLQLPPDERIRFLEEAWDALAESPQDVGVPEWHVQEVQRRARVAEPRYLSWEEVKERLGKPRTSR